MSSSDYAYSGKVLRTLGYCMDFKLTRLFRIVAGSFFASLGDTLSGKSAAAPRPSAVLCRRQATPANETA
jgi:hypothetical protein